MRKSVCYKMDCTTMSPGMQVRITFEDYQRRKRLEMSKSASLTQSFTGGSRAKTYRVTLLTEQQLPAAAQAKSIISTRIAMLIDPYSPHLSRQHVSTLYRTLLALKYLHYTSAATDFGDFYPPEQKINLNGPAKFGAAEEVLVAKIVNLVDETLNSAEESGVTTAISSLVHFAHDMGREYGFRRDQRLDAYSKICQAMSKKLAQRFRARGALTEDWDDAKLAALLAKHLKARNTEMMAEYLRVRYFRKFTHLGLIEPLPLTADTLKRAFPYKYAGPAAIFLQQLCDASEAAFGMSFSLFCDEVRFY